ncbi:VOC family protein [Heyndrickxia acidiproducens]|uniref:SMU1112c/YaeR family gloxylase I-like metalloprotein n=1 Tax=Heyndrickxia acidiproducens TaxID=1121084 RepID=UPI000477465C|nr:VOC family protein [Heyndrickxia acidiproducens]
MGLKRVHHIAIICSDYERSKHFYVNILGLEPVREVYRAARDSYKLDLAVAGMYQIELFSFPSPPGRPSFPEAAGLRHLAFEVENVEASKVYLEQAGIQVENVRTDPYTNKKFTFFQDPDGLPIELYEAGSKRV